MHALALNPHVVFLTALETASADPVSWLVNYGVAGIVIALLAMGRFRTKQEVDGLRGQLAEAREDSKEKDAALTAMMQQITNHTLPQMSHLADVLDRMPSSEPSIKAQMDAMAATLARLDQRTGGA